MIGIFDSGLGGLTALKELRSLLHNEDIIYFGDTGRVPYGTRSRETIIKYAREDMRFLITHSVDAVLVACGTVSSAALDVLSAEFDVPIFGVIDSATKTALRATKNGRIGVIGTNATIGSGAFERAIRSHARNNIDAKREPEIYSVACPLFVPLVEGGFVTPGDEITLAAARRYLSPLAASGIDTLILGCTHYPIISWAISAALPGITLISSGRAAADDLAARIASGEIKTIIPVVGSVRCFVSVNSEDFDAIASIFMGGEHINSVSNNDNEKN